MIRLSLLTAILDAIHKENDRIGGRAVSRLTAPLLAAEVGSLSVLSTIGFGEYTDGTGNARLLIDGEIVDVTTRTNAAPFSFQTLTRGVSNSVVKAHPEGTLVYDMSENSSAVDHLRRGFLVDFAIGEDLDIIGRNLGLGKCPGVSQEQLRRIIKGVAYLPRTTQHAFLSALEALFGNVADFEVYERTATSPFTVFVKITVDLSNDIRGRFILNGGTPALTTGLTTVDTNYDINHVSGVYLDTVLTRRGYRDGFTNYATTNTFAGATVTLDASPGPIGTAVLVDYGAEPAHYLAEDETIRQDLLNQDHWAYVSDPLLTVRCLLEQIRAAGVRVVVSAQA